VTPDYISMTWPQYQRSCCSFRGQEVRLTPQLADALLVLLLRRGEPLSREDLIVALWPDPDLEGEAPEVHVKVLVCRLRKVLPGLIRTWGAKSGLGWIIDRPEDAERLDQAA
jgi:DNA-binding response OmpR family regulator